MNSGSLRKQAAFLFPYFIFLIFTFLFNYNDNYQPKHYRQPLYALCTY